MSQPNGRPESAAGAAARCPPTLATVAHEAGVSRQTVSNALNNPDLLRPETLERVQAVIERLGYSPNRAARQLRTRSSHLIGLRFEAAQEGTSNALMDRFLHSLVEAASRTGHHVLLFSGDPDDPLDGYDDLLRSTAVDAFVVTDTYAGTPQSGFLKERGAPFVTFGRPWDEPDADHAWIDVDGAHGARLATEHLLEQGHQRVAWLGWEKSSRIGQDRRQRLGDGDARGRSGHAGSRRTTHGQRRRRPDGHPRPAAGPARSPAFACASDTLAIGALHACAERGLEPGRDVGVVGFDDSLAAQVTWPGLTLGAPAARAGRRRAGADPAHRARAQAAHRQGPDAAARARRTPVQPARDLTRLSSVSSRGSTR